MDIKHSTSRYRDRDRETKDVNTKGETDSQEQTLMTRFELQELR